jgi:HEAT repeat protein
MPSAYVNAPMNQPRKPRSIRATEAGILKLKQAQDSQGDDNGKLTYDRIYEKTGINQKTIGRFFRGEVVDRGNAIAIVQALGLDINEIVDPKKWNPVEQTSDSIDWHEICGEVLAQQRANQRLRRQATERGFELNVYVPLGLVDRKQQQRRCGDVPLEQVYQLTEEVITKEYDNDKFLTEVIEPGKSRRIAIIGEPGAGKTTLQEKIAVWIQDNNKGLPICIPLGGLQGKSLEDYLQQIWLKAALRFIEPDASGVEAQAFASLKQQFREGKVWLLLDGVDEMAATSPVEALATIKEQLTDWLVEARVVLTCRLNVWDANVNNLLTGFETYRTLEFKPEQVEDFIRQWFACAEESQTDLTPPAPLPYQGMGEPDSPLLAGEGQGERSACAEESQRGEELLRKLQEPGKERIRELVRNPLRLSLLCQTSYLLPVDEPLPETKAALYERFTRYFYEWKQEQHLDLAEKDELIDELHQALCKLALAGINSAARFRLGRKLARQEMGDRLFKLAEHLNWLVLVDREAKTDEAVYAFFHPTFQEYFAACAIDDWHFFLNHVPDNPKQGIYRIFEPQWKEVILLWLGREDIVKERKEALIKALVEFEDGCNGIYAYQAGFLAVVGLAEFKDCSFADNLVLVAVNIGFGYFNTETQNWMRFISPIAEVAREVLKESDREKVITVLADLIKTTDLPDYISQKIAESLLQIAPSNFEAIKALINLARNSSNESIRHLSIQSLGLICAEKFEVSKALICLMDTIYDKNTLQIIASTLGEISAGGSEVIKALLKLMGDSFDERTRSCAAYNLFKVSRDKVQAIAVLIDLMCTSSDRFLPLDIAIALMEIAPINSEVLTYLIDLLYRNPDKNTCELIDVSLDKITSANAEVTPNVIALIDTNPNEDVLRSAARILSKVAPGNAKAIEILTSLMSSMDEDVRRKSAYRLAKIDITNSRAIDVLIDLLYVSPYEETRRKVARSLESGEIGSGNFQVLKALINLMNNSFHEETRRQAVSSLGKIGTGNQKAISALINLINDSLDEKTRRQAVSSLGKIGTGNPQAISTLISLIDNCLDEATRCQAASNLAQIDCGNPIAITALFDLLSNSQRSYGQATQALIEIIRANLCSCSIVVSRLKDLISVNYKNDFNRYKDCYEVIWHCAQNLSYPDFYQAWHQATIQ